MNKFPKIIKIQNIYTYTQLLYKLKIVYNLIVIIALLSVPKFLFMIFKIIVNWIVVTFYVRVHFKPGNNLEENTLIFFYFLLDIFFIYISNAILKVPYNLPLPFPPPPIPTSWPWRSPVLRHIKFARPSGLSSQWWPTRPSSATYAVRDTSSGDTG